MSNAPLNREARMHRLLNQRRIALSLIERCQSLLAPGLPFSSELHQLFKQQGNFGSSDRRLYRDLIFTYLRYQPWLDEIKQDKDTFLNTIITLAVPTKDIFTLYPTLGDEKPSDYSPFSRHRLIGKTDEELLEILPSWFSSHCSQQLSTEELLTLFQRPPMWLRIQKGNLPALLSAIDAIAREGAEPALLHSEVPDCVSAPTDLPLVKLPPYENGDVEVQDISSQLLLQLLGFEARGNWLDACAGAGGKSLQLAKLLGRQGKVFAYDVRQKALKELETRRQKAGLKNIETITGFPRYETFDGVLIDAPCSGSGTWRRSPFLMRQLGEKDIMRQSERQLKILDQYSNLVAPGGHLVYCTCSISRYENEVVAQQFLQANSTEFQYAPLANKFGLEDSGSGITIYPHKFNGDGLFICCFRRRANDEPASTPPAHAAAKAYGANI